MNGIDWVTAGTCAGFLLFGIVAAISGVGVAQWILRTVVGALVGGLSGWAITRFLAYRPPISRPPKKPQNEEEFIPIDLANQAEVIRRDSEHP